MSQITQNTDRIGPDILAAFSPAWLRDEVVPAVEHGWQGGIRDLRVIRTGTYLESVGLAEFTVTGDGATATIDSVHYSGWIKRGRGGNYDYVGRRAAEEGLRKADPDIRAALDGAGQKVEG
ncbi:MAG TPA: hypothetical protein VK421_06060 [Pyrinomonadaceae bacterium]|nr:hypothetical protein [Pyrinomonadaceae bacterium]